MAGVLIELQGIKIYSVLYNLQVQPENYMVSYKSSAVKIFCSYMRRYGFHLSDHTVEICQRKFWSNPLVG